MNSKPRALAIVGLLMMSAALGFGVGQETKPKPKLQYVVYVLSKECVDKIVPGHDFQIVIPLKDAVTREPDMEHMTAEGMTSVILFKADKPGCIIKFEVRREK